MKLKFILTFIIGVLLFSIVILAYKVTQIPDKALPGKPDLPGNTNNKNIGSERNSDIPGVNAGRSNPNGMGNSRGSCLADGCLAVDDLNYPAGDLTEDAKGALLSALDDEYKAWATYDAVIKEYGNVRPFIMIIRAEEQHIASLKSLFDKYAVGIPENPYTGKITVPETISDACSTGVDAEIENARLYKEALLPKVREYEDITAVFTSLMNASQQKHLPAFQRCAE